MSVFDDFLALARDAVKSDGDDDNLLTQYAKSSITIASGYCRRNVYLDPADRNTDMLTVNAKIDAAETAWATAQETYNDCTVAGNEAKLDLAWRTYIADSTAATMISDSIVADSAVLAALLLITGHLYKNRQEVVTGLSAAAVQLPMGAQRILEPYMAV